MTRRQAVICMTMAILLFGCAPSPSDLPLPTTEDEQYPSAYLADIESRVITSEIPGRQYQISVALPRGYQESTASYPVLYAVDANGQFGTVVETARLLYFAGAQIPQLVIVGIGYPYGGWQIDAEPHRIVDFFSTLDQEWIADRLPGWPHPEASYEMGYANEFLSFIRDELFPMVEVEYRVEPNGRALYGHSGGGWFGLFALFRGQGAFERVIVGSPSLWWDDNLMFEIESSFAETNPSLEARVFLSVGSEEEGVFPMVSGLEQMAGVLERREYELLDWRDHYFEGENHVSVIPSTISRGLRFIYSLEVSFPVYGYCRLPIWSWCVRIQRFHLPVLSTTRNSGFGRQALFFGRFH